MADSIFDSGVGAMMPLKEKFEYHTLTITLDAGEGDGSFSHKVECNGGDKDDCVCSPNFCQMDDTIKMIGLFDVLKSAGDIELARLSARMDWSDPEEPWIEVEP